MEVDARVDPVGGRIPSQDQAEYGLKVSLWIRPWIKGVHVPCEGADPAEGGGGGDWVQNQNFPNRHLHNIIIKIPSHVCIA